MNRKNDKNSLYLIWAVAIVPAFSSSCSRCSSPRSRGERGGYNDGAALLGGERHRPREARGEGEDTPPEGQGENGDPSGIPSAEPVSSAQLAETEDAGQDYIDRLTFLGDSTTNGLKEYGVLSGGEGTTQVWTPRSGTLTLYLWNAAPHSLPGDG